MKKDHITIMLLTLVVAACYKVTPESDYQRKHSTEIAARTMERQMWQYYDSIEKEVRKDLGVNEENVVERIQYLIDQGYVKKPVVFFTSQNGIESKTVDYITYKKLTSGRSVGMGDANGFTIRSVDTLSFDSLRKTLSRQSISDTLK